MTAEDELQKIRDQMSALFAKAAEHAFPVSHLHPQLHQLAVEADAILRGQLGLANAFSSHLRRATHAKADGYLGDPLIDVMIAAHATITAAINHLRRQPMLAQQIDAPKKPPYVDGSTIAALGSLSHSLFDFSRLVQMCRELNAAFEGGAYISVVILVRAILDHVPPVFGETSYAAVANKMPKSIKGSLLNLENSSRNIADSRLHQQIRRRETVPTATEVNFSQDLAVLLDEVINAAKGSR